jgi:hypothetical protein
LKTQSFLNNAKDVEVDIPFAVRMTLQCIEGHKFFCNVADAMVFLQHNLPDRNISEAVKILPSSQTSLKSSCQVERGLFRIMDTQPQASNLIRPMKKMENQRCNPLFL